MVCKRYEIIRLHDTGLSRDEIARALLTGKSYVSRVINEEKATRRQKAARRAQRGTPSLPRFKWERADV